MDSVSTQQYVSPLIFCPYAQFRNKEDEFRLIQFGDLSILPLPDAENDVSSFPNLSTHDVRRPLDLCCKEDGQDYYYACDVCARQIVNTTFYSCKNCRGKFSAFFHKECVEPISKHPYHSKHILRFVENIIRKKVCLCCSQSIYHFYSCSICDFTLCKICSKKPPLLAINHPKRHEHTLLYFPINGSSSTCNVCGLSDHISLMYTCIQCDFVVHKECVYFPCVLRISRHEHRLSFTSSLTSERWSCGVCRGKMDTNYGRYSCVKGCSYSVHSRCATRYDVWDGKELEGTPEEDAYEEETKSFIEISDGIIQHFSHKNHHMRLDNETDRAFDETKRCQACALPICDDIIYSCMQCDFVLHQECAYLPRRKQHAMHSHPLTLKVDDPKDYFRCIICSRISSGFKYTCCEGGCYLKLDVCCASVSEPYHYQHHPHPLFLTSAPLTSQICSICRKWSWCLNCGSCSFVLCFRCATLPNKMRYKYEEHYLSLFYNTDAGGQYWCDVCEEEADPANGIFMCNDCNVTLHHACLLGREAMYMMPGGILNVVGGSVKVLVNNRRLTRNICTRCHDRCQENMVYEKSNGNIVCSFRCF